MTATEVAALLDLKPHPEGGFYNETFRDGSITLSTSQLPPQCTYAARAVASRIVWLFGWRRISARFTSPRLWARIVALHGL
jgi:predicted cupin superfamily sugar epimerase